MAPYPLLLALALGQTAAAPGQDGPPMSVQVGVFAYRADGSSTASATTGGVLGPFEGNVFASSPCSVGSGSKEPPATARHAWRITGQVIDISADTAVVQVDWQRSKESGEATNGPAGSDRLTLQNGTPVVLDSVWADASATCDVVRITLEARLAPRAVGRGGGVGFGPRGGGVGGVRVGSGGGSGSGSGAGTGLRSGSGSGGGAGIGSKDGSSSDASYDVEVWLIHQPAVGAERVLQAKPRFKGDWFRLTFLPLRIETPRGPLDVAVGISLALTTGTGGDRELSVSTSRKVNFVLAGGDGRTSTRKPEESGGSSETKLAMPGPAEVLSFEMPPLHLPTGGPALPDRLSVRLRIKPVE